MSEHTVSGQPPRVRFELVDVVKRVAEQPNMPIMTDQPLVDPSYNDMAPEFAKKFLTGMAMLQYLSIAFVEFNGDSHEIAVARTEALKVQMDRLTDPEYEEVIEGLLAVHTLAEENAKFFVAKTREWRKQLAEKWDREVEEAQKRKDAIVQQFQSMIESLASSMDDDDEAPPAPPTGGMVS